MRTPTTPAPPIVNNQQIVAEVVVQMAVDPATEALRRVSPSEIQGPVQTLMDEYWIRVPARIIIG